MTLDGGREVRRRLNASRRGGEGDGSDAIRVCDRSSVGDKADGRKECLLTWQYDCL